MAKRNRDMRVLAQLFRVLGDETRLRILTSLQEAGEMNVTQLHKKLKAPQPTVSHHLGILRMSDLVNHRRNGKEIFYSINDQQPDKVQRSLKALLNGSPTVRFGSMVMGMAPK